MWCICIVFLSFKKKKFITPRASFDPCLKNPRSWIVFLILYCVMQNCGFASTCLKFVTFLPLNVHHWVCTLQVQYSNFVKPAFDDFILPTKKYADIIIPRGGDNHVAIDLIVQHIRTKLGQHDLCKIYPNLYVIQSTFQVQQLDF